MISKQGGIQCVAALLLLLQLVPGQSSDLSFSAKTWDFYNRFQGDNEILGRLSSDSQFNKQPQRAMLQFVAQQFCVFDEECFPDVIRNVPDSDILLHFVQRLFCRNITAEAACDSQQECIWLSTSGCVVDFTAQIQDCLDPTYLPIHRRLFDCDRLATQSKCTSIAGCLWNGSACEPDDDAFRAALQQNQLAAQNLQQQLACQDAVLCTGPCEAFPNGNCFFPGIFDYAPFVTSTTPFCNYMREVSVCAATFDESECGGSCIVNTNGACVFPAHSQEFVDIAYVSNPTLQDQMKIAVDQCPTITLPSACNAFRP